MNNSNNQASTFRKGFTHGGIFHADDVFSTAFLRMLNPEMEVFRGTKVPEDFDGIVYDIGMGSYDHHQPDAPVRKNGIPYASFGLLWKAFAEELVDQIGASRIDDMLVEKIDAADNGVVRNPLSTAISMMNYWGEEEALSQEERFWKAEALAEDMLKAFVSKEQRRQRDTALMKTYLEQSTGSIVVMDQYLYWREALQGTGKKFCVYPSDRGGWCAAIVPQAAETAETREQNPKLQNRQKTSEPVRKLRFPESWSDPEQAARMKEQYGLRFCHKEGFLINTDTREQACELCRMAERMDALCLNADQNYFQ